MEDLQQLGLAESFVDKTLGSIYGTSLSRDEAVFRLQVPHSADERFLPMYNLQ